MSDAACVYRCKDNDTVITTTYLDGCPDEVLIHIPGDSGAYIIGYEDMKQAMADVEKLASHIATAEIMGDPEMTHQLNESKQDIKEGKTVTLDELEERLKDK